jgi:hypothetical protein
MRPPRDVLVELRDLMRETRDKTDESGERIDAIESRLDALEQRTETGESWASPADVAILICFAGAAAVAATGNKGWGCRGGSGHREVVMTQRIPMTHVVHKDGVFIGAISHENGAKDQRSRQAWRREVARFCGEAIVDGQTVTTVYSREEYKTLIESLDVEGLKSKGDKSAEGGQFSVGVKIEPTGGGDAG